MDDSDADPHYKPGINDQDSDSSSNEEPQSQHQDPVHAKSPVDNPHQTACVNKLPVKRKRLCQRAEAKKRRNCGQSYKTYRGKKVEKPAANIGPDCNCPLKCFEKVDGNNRKLLFSGFWDLKEYNNQTAYLYGLIRIYKVKRRYSVGEKRGKTAIYYVNTIGGIEIRVCKKAFTNIHGITRGRVDILVKKKGLENPTTPPMDQRGLHDNRPHSCTDEQHEHVVKFLNLIPTYQSHYCRKDNPNKMYFGYDCSVHTLYDDYTDSYCKINNINKPVSLDRFRRILKTFNVGFKRPKTDSCKSCDSFVLKIKDGKLKGIDTSQLERERDLHIRKGEAGQTNLKKFRTLAKKEENLHVISFDLQQALPIPRLTTGPAFYKRKLWGYNLGVHCLGTEQGFCFFWSETEAGRGSDEIISCLHEYITKNDVRAERFVGISDNCGGQNKNWNMIRFWLYMLSTGRFNTIEHHFPLPGHTMLPSDEDFGIIETYVRRHVGPVYTPEEWVTILEKACRKRPMQVCHMRQAQFLSFASLRDCVQEKLITEDSIKINFHEVVKFRFRREFPLKVEVTTSYGADNWESINLAKKGKAKDLSKCVFKRKYNSLKAVDALKMKDVKSMYDYIPSGVIKSYYETIFLTKKTTSVDNEEPGECSE